MDLTELKRLDGQEISGFRVFYFDECASTNTLASAAAGCGDRVYISALQTEGRGRLGRRWDNKKGSSLTFSVLKKTRLPSEKLYLVTPTAGLCVREAVENVCGIKCGVKWPNDILYGGRKICGILTEAPPSLDSVIVGMGINVSGREWNEELRAKAASIEDVCGCGISGKRLLEEILRLFSEKLAALEGAGNFSPFIGEYEKELVNTGKHVRVSSASVSFEGTALGIDRDVRLLVEKEDGTVEAVDQGDVTLAL